MRTRGASGRLKAISLSETLRTRGREAVSWCIRLAASADQDTALVAPEHTYRYALAPACASAASA
jgi:hypothetical protein